MTSTVTGIGLKGMEGYRVSVEVEAVNGVNSMVIVGLPDASVKESKERISAAFHALGFFHRHQKLIINLSPAEQRKNSPMFDLPIAMAILLELGEINPRIPDSSAFIGALSLDGSVHVVESMLPAVIAAKKLGLKKLYLPYDDCFSLLDIEEPELVFVRDLQDVIKLLYGHKIPQPFLKKPQRESSIHHQLDFQNIIGQSDAKHALEIAAAGEHHVLLSGPPGCGKSMLAESFPSILPELTTDRRLELLSIYQLSGMPLESFVSPPFRSPHHSSSSVSIIGGGQNPKLGEISLAHHGVLFLDEIAEFPKKTLEMLRQPLETEKVTISRVHATVMYPSSFILLGAMNPCPCGYNGSKNHYCTCSKNQVFAYQNKLSGPLRDRFDIFLKLDTENIGNQPKVPQESSETIRERVTQARERQYCRYGKEVANSRISYDLLVKKSPLSNRQQNLLQKIAQKQGLSIRAQIKMFRLARTIADLEKRDKIIDQNLWEAIKLHRPNQFTTGKSMRMEG
ncbi:YifB family Mg chelatase-like AAA ATPase [Neobacillus sp. SM06]|uniref:YifB family Mg chelatase-like AAA ATPase n=1 Tax=Neobacillus sp. SM06 TaxID=3422492 RepID=UPI003D2741D1